MKKRTVSKSPALAAPYGVGIGNHNRYAIGPTQARAWQPKGTRDGSRELRGRKVFICRCTSEKCGLAYGAYATRRKANARRKRMETESGCIVNIECWKIH